MNTTRDSGGPAFPNPAVYDPSREQVNPSAAYGAGPGMTLRDYFIAHAPAEPQPWFEPVTKTERPGSAYYNEKAFRAWEAEYQRERYIQWPAAWADEMLKQRAK